MREIKFRVWDMAHNRLIYIVGFASCNNEVRTWYFDGEVLVNESFKPSMIVIEQYTGLKDKNGKEIFEGDILGGFIGMVIHWCNKSNGWQLAENHEENTCVCYRCSGEVELGDYVIADLEVIGNIHENPELLEGE